MCICTRTLISEASTLLSVGHVTPALSFQVHDELHKGRFGFPVSNFLALTPLNNGWCQSWAEFFKRRLTDQIDGLTKVIARPHDASSIARAFPYSDTGRAACTPQGTHVVSLDEDVWKADIKCGLEG